MKKLKIIFNTTTQYWRYLWSQCSTALGLLLMLWGVLELYCKELPDIWGKVLAIAFILASILYAFRQLFRHPDTLELEINKRTKLKIEKGDIFTLSADGVCVIPVNEYFDTHLGDGIINPRSLHGQLIVRFNGRENELRDMIDQSLSRKEDLPNGRIRTMVPNLPQKRYPLGTCVRINDGERLFMLVAISRFNEDEHVEVAAEEYPEVIRKMYNGIENLNDGKTVYMPLVGSGISGYQLNEMQLLNTMIQSAHNAKTLAVTNGLHLCIYGDEMWNALNLNVIEYLYDSWKSLSKME